METILVYPAGTGDALQHASGFLQKYGIPLVDHPTPEVTHLLLDIPTRTVPELLLERLPETITIAGGNLIHPALAHYRRMDLLQDPLYTAQNAAITAECALQIAASHSRTVFADTPVLVIGWGRIGKCLASLLKHIGAVVTVAARKASDRAILTALGYHTADTNSLAALLPEFRFIFNTVPKLILDDRQLSLCRDCVKIELASSPGLDGDDIVIARGLPGRYAPESSGKLIAETFLRLLKEGAS